MFHSVKNLIWWDYITPLHKDITHFEVINRLQRLLLQLLYLTWKLFFLVTSNSLGSLKLKYIRQSSMIEILFVLNSFIKNRLTAKSKELMTVLFRQQASVPYIRIDRHLLSTSCRITSSEANLPSLPNIAFNERWYARLAWSNEQQKTRELIIKIPRYRISLTHGSEWPFMVMISQQWFSKRGPICIQHDLFTLIVMSNHFNSRSHVLSNICSSLTVDDIRRMSSAYKTI